MALLNLEGSWHQIKFASVIMTMEVLVFKISTFL